MNREADQLTSPVAPIPPPDSWTVDVSPVPAVEPEDPIDLLIERARGLLERGERLFGEGAVEEDLRTIASVYHNRLSRGMRLQADPTVVYALGERRRLMNRNYATESPFNTYIIEGLPPSPIGSPSSRSLEAALYPDSTDFLYFVAQPDGRHRFSLTYDEHLRAIGEIRGDGGDPGPLD